ncbi:MAG: hypothetical protein U9Q78_04590 [Chloroflexota bacterium]|nr:hypothetical protein [Chloroflexota bacterium]
MNTPWHIQNLEGKPITVGATVLTPQARLITIGRRQGEVTKQGWGGWGWALALLAPKAIIVRARDQCAGEEPKRIPIPDRTGQALAVMAIVGLAVALLSVFVQMFSRSSSAGRKGD